MKKEDADRIIAEYKETIFGFAFSKEFDIDKAEEVAACIVFDVYKSLLNVEKIEYIDSYIYKTSCNVYARFVEEEKKHKHLLENHQDIIFENSDNDTQSKEDVYNRLHAEIRYLGKIYRETINMYYFDKMKVYEIALKLNIPIGSVKYQLHNARKALKENMTMQFKDTCQATYVKFKGVGQHGTVGTNGEDVDTYLGKLLAQNIAYSAYYEAKTITEIARDLCVPAIFIENEIAVLEEYGYIDKLTGGKYLTNILIIEYSRRALEQKHKVYTKYAKYVCDLYVPLLIKAMENRDAKKIYTPKNDLNFLLWSIISFACKFKLTLNDKNNLLKKFHIKRKDGSINFAFAWIEENIKWQELSYVQKLYDSLEDINYFGGKAKRSWQFNTYYDNRKAGWEDYAGLDVENLHSHLTGKITKDPSHVEKYARLYEKCYLIGVNEKDYVNMVVTCSSDSDLLNTLPDMPVKLKNISKELDDELFEIDKTQFPEHMHNVCKVWNTDVLTSSEIRTRIIEQLLQNKTLKELTELQKMTVNTILFSDVVPD
ncbi:MAG: sigma-70 family RNA polymerase sigma factor [Candidatus Cloacimonetes bacterium]|nr:sigma-70 family RNA polymerase sigma factor [Candidatus Cloacimonadota bacterium]